jgi:uncharacterized protein (TIGR00645 family)
MIRRWFENVLFASRWLLAPLFFVLIVGLLALVLRTIEALYSVGLTVFSGTEEMLIVEILKVVDLTLTGLLLVIIVVSGFENFVGRVDPSSRPNLPEWMTHIDFAGSKLWLLTSVIAISGIRLLDMYINISANSDRDLTWSAIIYATFIVSAVVLALVDLLHRIGRSAHE